MQSGSLVHPGDNMSVILMKPTGLTFIVRYRSLRTLEQETSKLQVQESCLVYYERCCSGLVRNLLTLEQKLKLL